MNKWISVIVPVYGVEAYLDRCVQSITQQTYRELEIILVDDGSPDRCPEICDEWASKDPRIKVIHKKNGGVSSARNEGIDAAQGAYLGFVDGDDWIAPDLFEKVMKIFDREDPDVVTFDCNRINEKGEIYTSTEKISQRMLTCEEALRELVKGNINNYAYNKVYKKFVFDGIRFPEGRVWEDMAIAYKLFLNCRRIYTYPEKLYFYYTRSDSLSKNMNERTLANIFLARYECHMAMKASMPSVMPLSLPQAALSARRLYDRSLWKPVDEEMLTLAKNFLAENRETILAQIGDQKYKLYFKHPTLYRLGRIARHRVGNVVKSLRKKAG